MGATDATTAPGKGLNFGGQGDALGVNGGVPAQGSLSSAIDRPSSPMNSVTNSLMGSIGTPGPTLPALKPVAKRKPAAKAAAASPSTRQRGRRRPRPLPPRPLELNSAPELIRRQRPCRRPRR